MKRVVTIMLALTMALCAVCALAAEPMITCAPGSEGGAEYLISNGNCYVYVSKAGEYTIEGWTTNESDYAYIKIDPAVQGEVVIRLKNVHLKTRTNAVQWNRDQYASGSGSRTLRLVFEEAEIEAGNFCYCVTMDDKKGADNVLIIDGEAAKLTSSDNDCISMNVENGSGVVRVEIAAADAQITAPGSMNYTDPIHIKNDGGVCEILVTGDRAQLTGACSAIRIDAKKSVVRLTGDGARASGNYGAEIWTDEASELILGAGVTLSARYDLIKSVGAYPRAAVKADGATYPYLQVMAADNAAGENSETIGEYDDLVTIEDGLYRYLRTVYVPKPDEPDDGNGGGNEGGGVPGEVMPEPDELPKTGDAHSIALYIALLAAGVMGVVMMLRRREA